MQDVVGAVPYHKVLRQYRTEIVRQMRSQIFCQIVQIECSHTPCMASEIYAEWWKICKQMACKAVRRSLCGVALSVPRYCDGRKLRVYLQGRPLVARYFLVCSQASVSPVLPFIKSSEGELNQGAGLFCISVTVRLSIGSGENPLSRYSV